MTKTGPGQDARRRQETLFMAKTSPSKQGAAAKPESKKRAAASRPASGVKGWPADETLRPLLEAKAPPAKPGRRGEPAAANAAPEPAAPPRPAKTPAPRRAERRTLSEVQTGPAPAEPPASAPAAAAPAATAPPPAPAPAKPPGAGAPLPAPDVEALAHNIAQAIELGGRVLAAYMRPRESGEIKTTIADDIGEMVRSIGRVAEYYMAEPQRAFAAQAALTTQFVDLWAATLQRLKGDKAEPVAPPDAGDKRFADAAWRDNPYFDFIKQAYVLTT
jgi:polyhydroxyalkanoate synthase subunit PhaC